MRTRSVSVPLRLPTAIVSTNLERLSKDNICSIGQTLAAQELCTGVRAYRRVHRMQAGVGHYGVFSGRRWNNEIYPLLRDFVHVNS